MVSRLRSFFSDLTELGISPTEIFQLTGLTVLFALFEGVGLGMLLPIAEFAAGDGSFSPGLATDLALALGLDETTGHERAVALLLGLAFLPFMLRVALQYARDLGVARLKYRIIGQVTKNTLAANIRADFSHVQRHDIGALQTYATVEAERAAEAMSGRMIFFTSLVLFLVYVVLMVTISFQLTLFIVPMFAVIAIMFRYHRRRTSVLSARISQKNRVLGSQINDNLSGIQRVKMRAREEATVGLVFATVDSIIAHRMGIERTHIQMQIGMNPVLVIAAFSVVYIGIVQLGLGLQSLGIYLLVLTRLGPQVVLMNAQWSNIYACMESFRALNVQREMAERRREFPERGECFTSFADAIELTDVVCDLETSDRAVRVLAGVSCRFPKHKTTAIVGRSGSGKTTLIRLLTGFYPPTGGRISIDGADLTRFSKSNLRLALALVPQEPYLFDDTVRGNLCYGIGGDISEARLEAVLRVAHCSEFVMRLPKGVDTPVGPRGSRLSQGQRQRLTIAHALLSDPQVLILDEPTSALDSESEQAIYDTLAALRGQLTIIIIAHRLGTIFHSDSIVVLDRGRVLAQGTHSELLEKVPLYHALFELDPTAERAQDSKRDRKGGVGFT